MRLKFKLMGILKGHFILILVVAMFNSKHGSINNIEISEVSNSPSSRWELTDEEEGIKFYVRWVPISDEQKVRERKVEILAHTSLDNALKMVTDMEKVRLWMSGIKKASLLHRDSKNQWYSYALYGLPWPFNDREMITLCKMKQEAAQPRISINMESIDQSYPPAKGVERLTNYKASWELIEINKTLVKMTFIARSGDPPAFPRVIQDPVIKKVFMGNMRALKSLLEKS